MKTKSEPDIHREFSVKYDLLLLIYRLKIIDLERANETLLVISHKGGLNIT